MFVGEDQEGSFGHVQFEMSNRYSKWSYQTGSHEFMFKVRAEEIKLRVISIWLFKAMRMEEITKGMCRQKRVQGLSLGAFQC